MASSLLAAAATVRYDLFITMFSISFLFGASCFRFCRGSKSCAFRFMCFLMCITSSLLGKTNCQKEHLCCDTIAFAYSLKPARILWISLWRSDSVPLVLVQCFPIVHIAWWFISFCKWFQLFKIRQYRVHVRQTRWFVGSICRQLLQHSSLVVLSSEIWLTLLSGDYDFRVLLWFSCCWTFILKIPCKFLSECPCWCEQKK